MELWHVPLRINPAQAARAATVLDARERARAERLRQPAHRHAYIAAHAALRHLLGQTLGQSPAALVFEQGLAGKPRLTEQQARQLRFNLSHSADCAVVALAHGREVGVDIECFPTPNHDLAELEAVFSPDEIASIAACRPAQRGLARLRCWVRKEAVLKAVGCGFGDEARRLSVSIGEQAHLLESRHPQVEGDGWSLAAFEQPGRWTAAVAVRGPLPGVTVHHWRWMP